MADKHRILYVDDERDLLDIGKLFLEDLGDFTVTTAISAPEAIGLLEQEKFDAIISDFQMPGMDGIQFLVEVRTRFGLTPFILFTGRGREEVVIQAINSGVDFYLQKGGDPKAQFAELAHKTRFAVERHAIEKALHTSEEKYRRIVESSHVGIWAMDGQFVTTYVNERMVEMLGYTVGEILGKAITSFMAEGELVDNQQKIEERMQGQPGSYERRFRAKDGTILTFAVSAAPIQGDEGLFQGSFAMLTDITARKRAEEELLKKNEELHASYEQIAATEEELRGNLDELARQEQGLRESETNLRAILDATPFPVALVDLEDNNINYWSRSALTLFGHTAPTAAKWYQLAYPDPDYRQDVITRWKPYLEEAKRSGQPVNTGEYRVTCRNGTVRICELYATFLADKLVVTFNDITERNVALAALTENEERLRTTLEILPVGVFIFSKTGQILMANAMVNRIWGVTEGVVPHSFGMAEFVEYKGWWPDTGVALRPEDWAASRVLMKGETAPVDIVNIQRFDGSFGTIIVSAVPFHDNGGNVTGAVAVIQDITEIRRAEEVLSAMLNGITESAFMITPDGTVLAANKTVAQRLGLERADELVGQNIFGLLPAEVQKSRYDKVQEVLLSGQPVEFEDLRDDRVIHQTIYPVKDPDDTVSRLIIFGNDITERKREELELESALKNLKEAHCLAHIGTWDWVVETDTVTWSEELCTIAGWDPSLPAPTYAELPRIYAPTSWNLLNEAVTTALTTGKPYDLELEMIRPDGSIRWTHAFGGVIRDGNEKITGLHGTVQDITESKRAEEALKKNTEELRAANEQLAATEEELKSQIDSLAESEERVRKKLESLLAPEGNSGALDLGDLIDPQTLQRLMDDFTRLTGMGMAILDTKGKVLVATGWQEICTKFHRVNPVTAGFCTESDLHLAKNMKQGEYVAYKCRNHLWDVVTPLYIGSKHMGNIFTGQFFYDDDLIDESGFTRQADKYGFDRDAYLAALHRVPIFSREKIAELMDYLVKLTGFLSRISYSNINLARMGTERDTLLTSLQKSEDKFRTLVENIPQKIFTKDLDSRYVTINENFGHDLGIHPDEIVGKSDADLFPADLAARYRVNDLRVIKTGQTEEFEEGYLLDGKETWVHTIKTAIRDKEGEIVGLLGIFWDITDKKRAEDVLAESEAKFRTLFESMAPGVFYQRADGTFIDANPAALDMFGLTREQFMGRDSYDPRWNIVSETGELLPVEQHPSMLALRSGKMVKDLIVGVYNPARDDMRWLSTNAEPQFRTGETLPYQVFVTMYDITGRKRAEEVLAESEKRFRQVFDSLPIGMWIADRNGKLLMGNPAGQDIWEAHPQVGQEEYGVFKAWRLPSHEMVRPDEWALGYAVNEGRVTTQELLEIEAFNGSHKFILNWAAPVKNDAGEITGAFVLNQDITDSVMSERALQESKSFLNILLEAIPIPVFYKDREGRYLGFNKAFENFYAKSKEQLIGKSVFDISPPELAKVYHAADIKLFEKPGIQVYDSQVLDSHSILHDVIFHNASLTDNQGSVTGLIGAIIDITERKRAEEALRESEEKYRTLVEKANEAIMIAQDDVFVFANSRMSDLLGVPAGKLEGKPFVDFIWPEDRDLVVTNHRKRIAGELISDAYDFRIIGAGGMLTWVYLSAAVIPWKGKTATLNLVTDITERKKAEEALRMSEQKLNSILNNITDVVWSLSWPDMKVHYISPSVEQVYGRSVQEFIDKPSLWAEVVYPDDRHISDKVLEELQKSGSAMRVCRIVRPDGSIAWIQDKSKFIYDEHGSPVRTEGITSDITARKRAEEALSRVNKKLTLLSGITRHDINNQLTVQMGYLNILEKKEPDTTRNEYFQKVSTAAKRISAMIQFTKEYEEIGVHAPAWQDGRTLVDTAAKQVPLGRVTVKNDLTAGTEVFADPLIAKVFYTLMDNAVRHGGKITAIRFSIEERDGDQVLICEDDGNGVVADEKEKIFERGFGKNTGLGLFISHEILGITGITITETGEPGKGARFEMVVPKGMWRFQDKK